MYDEIYAFLMFISIPGSFCCSRGRQLRDECTMSHRRTQIDISQNSGPRCLESHVNIWHNLTEFIGACRAWVWQFSAHSQTVIQGPTKTGFECKRIFISFVPLATISLPALCFHEGKTSSTSQWQGYQLYQKRFI